MSVRSRGLTAAALLALYALPWALDVVRLRMAIEILYFGLFAVSFNLLFGYAGLLSFGQYDEHLPFPPRRYFVVYDVPGKDVRGEHAHRTLHQLLLCVKGSVSIVLDDGRGRDEVGLDRPQIALYVPPMVWTSQYRYSGDAVLLVLASDVYDADDYIRDYDEFLRTAGEGR